MGKGLGPHCTFVSPKGLLSASPSPLLCPHRAPRSRADTDTISPTQSCQLQDRGHGQPLRGNGRSCVCWELAVGSGGYSLHVSDSSCCLPPEDRGAGGVCSPGPLARGHSQTLSTVTLCSGACTHLTDEKTEVREVN